MDEIPGHVHFRKSLRFHKRGIWTLKECVDQILFPPSDELSLPIKSLWPHCPPDVQSAIRAWSKYSDDEYFLRCVGNSWSTPASSVTDLTVKLDEAGTGTVRFTRIVHRALDDLPDEHQDVHIDHNHFYRRRRRELKSYFRTNSAESI